MALTEEALLADLQEEQQLLTYILLAVLAAGVASIVFLARQYGGALQLIRERPKFCEASEEAIQALIRQGFIRVGSGTRRLPTSKVLEYVEKRAAA